MRIFDIVLNRTYQLARQYFRKKSFPKKWCSFIPMEDWEIKDIINRQNRTMAYVRFRPKFRRPFELRLSPIRRVTYEFDVLAINHGIKAITLLDCMIVKAPLVQIAYFCNDILLLDRRII